MVEDLAHFNIKVLSFGQESSQLLPRHSCDNFGGYPSNNFTSLAIQIGDWLYHLMRWIDPRFFDSFFEVFWQEFAEAVMRPVQKHAFRLREHMLEQTRVMESHPSRESYGKSHVRYLSHIPYIGSQPSILDLGT